MVVMLMDMSREELEGPPDFGHTSTSHEREWLQAPGEMRVKNCDRE
jgi:hypothetical protein